MELCEQESESGALHLKVHDETNEIKSATGKRRMEASEELLTEVCRERNGAEI